MNFEEKTSCNRCGSCCQQGGPALHTRDWTLVSKGNLTFEDLVTVRQGELALQPLAGKPSPVDREFIKIQGQGGDWCCKFYDRSGQACTIYANRPLACSLLDCTAPEAILSITGKDLLTRFDCITEDDPLLPLVKLHHQECPFPEIEDLPSRLSVEESRHGILRDLSLAVNTDLALRTRAVSLHGLTVARELFYFGRPLFQLLTPLNIRFTETVNGLSLSLDYGG